MKIDRIIRTRRRSICLIVEHDGSLVVRAPLSLSDRKINDFVEKKTGWIISKQEQARATFAKSKPKAFKKGDEFWYLGKLYPLEIVEGARKSLVLDGCFYLKNNLAGKAKTVFTGWYRKQAAQILNERVAWMASRHGFHYQQVKITSAKTRWGSCNGKESLCFPWRLVMAPLPVIDYVVVHELAHTRERNHGKSFWKIVMSIQPDYKQKIQWLKSHGNSLNL
jgi:predicted metal-dependent hydrolase